MVKRRTALLACGLLITVSIESLAFKRLQDASELYGKERYEAALKKIADYISDYPKDSLAAELLELTSKKLAAGHLKRGYTLISEGLDRMAGEELDKASAYHPGYASAISDDFIKLLEENTSREAANRILFQMLKDPQPPVNAVYALSARIRHRLAGVMADGERADFEELSDRVARLRQRKRWSSAVDLVMDYIRNHPGSVDAQVLLSEINREAAQDFYSQAVAQLERNRVKSGRDLAESSRQHDEEWFEQRISDDIEEVKIKIALGEISEAKYQLKLIENLEPGNPNPHLYLSLFDESHAGFLERSIEKYKTRHYVQAAARFDFLRLKEPGNRNARLYYHLASARAFIGTQNLEKIREHLIKALEISPGEKEALEIFDRLQDVMEIMGKT